MLFGDRNLGLLLKAQPSPWHHTSNHFMYVSQKARELGVTGGEFEPFSALTVTVPGAAAAWEDTINTFGKLSLKEVRRA